MPNYISKNEKGFTILELGIVVLIIVVLTSTILLTINPEQKRREGRDNKRLSDIALLDRMINEYLLDYGAYPDSVDTLRTSIVLPDGNEALDKAAFGWIDVDFSEYSSKLPLDPINDANLFYSYIHTINTYELNTILETFTDIASSDGGDDPTRYETGNELTLISP